jgi:glutamate decarboxylase
MVHLGKVATDRDIADSKLPELENLDIGAEDQNEITTSVYGSRFAAQDLPKHEMPDGEMPREMAYRLIKDDLTLDGNPTLK